MARKSKADEVVLENFEKLIRRLHDLAGVDRSLKQVLEANPMLLGEVLMITRIVLELDHLKTDDPVIGAFIEAQFTPGV